MELTTKENGKYKEVEVEKTPTKARGRFVTIQDEFVKNSMIQAIGMGATIKQACSIAGIPPTRWKAWNQKAKDGELEYVEFFEELEMAADRAIMRKLIKIDQASEAGQWQASAWWLERNYPELYAIRMRNEITGKDGEDIKIVIDWPS